MSETRLLSHTHKSEGIDQHNKPGPDGPGLRSWLLGGKQCNPLRRTRPVAHIFEKRPGRRVSCRYHNCQTDNHQRFVKSSASSDMMLLRSVTYYDLSVLQGRTPVLKPHWCKHLQRTMRIWFVIRSPHARRSFQWELVMNPEAEAVWRKGEA